MIILKTTKILVLLGFLIVNIGALSQNRSQPPKMKLVAANNQPHLKFEVSTSNRKYLQREPIPIDFKLSNQDSVPITWIGIFRSFSPNTNLISRSENGTEIRYIGNNSTSVDELASSAIIQPGRNLESKNLISDFLVKKLFPSPGRYELTVEFIYAEIIFGQQTLEKLVSEPIIIIVEKTSGVDRKAYDYLENVFDPANISDSLKGMIARQYFADNFSDSVYWKYETFRLARFYSATGKYEKAEREFLKIYEIDYYYSEKIEREFIILARKLGRDKRKPKFRKGYINEPMPQIITLPPPMPIPLPDNAPVWIPIPNPKP